MTITSSTRITSTRVTRDFGNAFTPLFAVPDTPQQPDPPSEGAVEQHRQTVGERQHHRHHHDCLQHEAQAGQPQFDAVPPTEETGHPVSVCASAAGGQR